jgi:transposase-like protein
VKSHEVLKKSLSDAGVKSVAAELNVSPSLVYKWCEEPREDPADDQSGARNPLDRVLEICRATGDTRAIAWLCEQNGSFMVSNPAAVAPEKIESCAFENTQALIKEFSDLLSEVAEAMRDDQRIDAAEAARIRGVWERLKSQAEGFAVACERGVFDRGRPQIANRKL